MINEKSRFLLVPFISLLFTTFYFALVGLPNGVEWVHAQHYLFVCVSAFVIWEGNRYIINRFDKKMSISLQNIRDRFIFQLTVSSLYFLLAFVVLFMCYVIVVLQYEEEQYDFPLKLGLLVGFLANALLNSLDAERRLLDLWSDSENEALAFKEQTIRSQLETLKTQLDPHFLFNNLNILSILIKKNSEEAGVFLNKFAEVYRYVLSSRTEEVVPLATELKFAESYAFLLSLRFGKNLSIEFDCDKAPEDARVIPIVLQMLIENAVKHNIVSSRQPLLIEIAITEGYLSVKNKKQARTDKQPSSGLGISSIRKRYGFLTGKMVKISRTEDIFEVQVPLLTTQT